MTVVRGHVARADGFVHWTQAARPGTDHIPARAQSVHIEDPQKFFGVEPLRRTKPLDRMNGVLGMLVDEVKKSIKQFGYPVLPHSVMRQVVSESWKLGDPIPSDWLEGYVKRLFGMDDRQQGRTYNIQAPVTTEPRPVIKEETCPAA